MKQALYLLAFAALMLASCGKEAKKNYVIQKVKLQAEGPLFDGSNTLQASYPLDLTALEPGLTADKVKHVKLISAEVLTTDSLGFDGIRSMSFTVTAADAKMQQLAVLNPMPKGISIAKLAPSTEADVKDLFKQNELILIVDVDLEGDLDGNLEYEGNFVFEVLYKQ
jgi:hypothetical protein